MAEDNTSIEKNKSEITNDESNVAHGVNSTDLFSQEVVEKAKERSQALTREERIAEHERLISNVISTSQELETKRAVNRKNNNNVTEIKYGNENDKEELDKKFRERYVKDQNNNYRWSFNNDIVAFQDKGKVIIVKGKPASVSEDVVKLLKSQGVIEIKVEGEKEHKQRIWIAATERGIEVKGYRPSKEELKEMEAMTNKITVLKQETDPKKNNKKEILKSHRVVATQVAEKILHPKNKALFVREALSEVNKKLSRGENVQKIVIKENKKELEK